MRCAGIDQSYTGFGYSVDGKALKKAFPISKFSHPDERLVSIREWFTDWLESEFRRGLDLVLMEGYSFGSKVGREQAGELGGLVRMVIYDVTGSHPLVVPPPSLKKFVTGAGNAKKNVMLLHVHKRWGVEFSDDNQADAFSLEKFGEAYLWHQSGISPKGRGLPKYQIEAIEKVLKDK